MHTRRYFLASAALSVVGISLPALAQTLDGLTAQQRLELRQRLQSATTEEERRRIRREYMEQLQTGGGQQTQGGGAQAAPVEGLTQQERTEMQQRLRNANTEQERELIRQEYRDRAHMRGQGMQQSGGQGKGGSGQQGMPKGQNGQQPLLLPQGKKGGKNK